MALPCHVPEKKAGGPSVRSLALLLLLVAPFLFTPEAAAQPATKKVLILTASDPNHPGFGVITQRIRSTVRDGSEDRVEILYELQQALIRPASIPLDEDDKKLVSYLKVKYGGQNLDLLVAAATPRLRLLLKNDPGLFAGVPKVFYDFEEEREPTYRDAGPNLTGVWARVDYSQTLDLALSLHPETRRVVVVAGTSPQEQERMANARAEFGRYEGRVEFNYLTNVSLAELKDQLAALPSDTIVYFLIFYIDRAGNRYPGPEPLLLVAPTSGAPIYANSGSYLGSGIVGGSLVDFEAIGTRLGNVSLRILNGERPEDIPPQTAPNMTVFDWRQLQRWGIDEQRLPPGSVVQFKQPSLWELYRWYIIGLVAACIIEALLIAWLLLLRARRRQAEAARRQSEERNRAILQALPDLMFLQTRDGVYLDYHARNGKELLSRPDDFIGKNMRDVLPRGLSERLFAYFRRLRETGEPQLCEYTLTLGGETRWYEARLVNSGENVLSIVRDITEREKGEAALRESEKFNHTILSSLNTHVCVLDRDGQVITVNTAWTEFARANGATSEECIGPGANYLEVCRRAADEGDELAWIAMEGVKAVCDGSQEFFSLEYPCHSPAKRGWFQMLATPLRRGEGGAVVAHNDITSRKESEEALRRSEQRWRQAQEAARVGSWEWDIATGVSVWSEIIWRLLGVAEDGSVPTVEKFIASIHPDDRDRVLRRVNEVIEGGEVYDDEFRVVRADGQVLWLASKGRLIRSASGQPLRMLGVNIDITARKQAEEALRDSMAVSEQNRAQLESVFHAATDGFVVSDTAGNVLFVNETMARLNGYESPDEMKRNLAYFGQHYELFDPDGQPVPYDEWPLSKALRGESVTNWELRVRRNDIGREWFFSYSAEPVRNERGEQVLALLVTHDITERKAAEEELRESEERFRTLADSAPVLIWVNGLEGCEFASRSYLEFLGRSLDEVRNMDWTTAIHPDDVESYVEAYHRAFEARAPFTGQFRFRRADGEYRWFKSIGQPRFTHDGMLLGYVGSSVDVTDIKHSEEALQLALEEVNRLKNQLHEENVYLREEIKLEHNFSEIIGHSDAIKYVLHKIEQVAPTDSTVLIMGETGTGKELVARAIHSESLRRDRPLVKVNCAALSPTLIESELFGHEKGSFTGATGRKIGRFELADGASIFLDEIGELPPELQVKLLRVIQEGELERLGGTRTLKVDVRIIAATNRHLWDEVQKGRFREDLWYRLNVFPITTPPLRQRAEDIPLLVEHFVNSFSKKMGKEITSVAPATLSALRNYPWPGNVRELANVIERAVINNSGTVLQLSGMAETLRAETPPASSKTLEEMEREYILTVLDHTGWKIEGGSGAARILGLHPSTLRTRMSKLNIRKPQQNPVGARHASH